MPPVHDYVIDNSTGANVRSDINSVLQAILSNNSSSSAPSTTAAYMWWADTTTGILKIRNSANDGWVELLQLDGTLTLEDGTASTPALAFRDDLNTGIFSSAADTFDIATGGVSRFQIDSSEITFNDSGAATDFRIEGDNNANLLFVDADVDKIGVGTNSPSNLFHCVTSDTTVARFESTASGSTGVELILHHNTSSPADNDKIGAIYFQGDHDGGSVHTYSYILTQASDVSNGSEDSFFAFYTSTSGTATEKVRFDETGRIGVGTSSFDDDREMIRIKNTGGDGTFLTIEAPNDSGSSEIFFGDSDFNRGRIAYEHNNDQMEFFVSDNKRMTIDTSGRVLIGLDSHAANNSIDNLQVGNPNDSNQSGITIGSNDEAAIAFANNGDARAGSITYNMGSDAMIFKTDGQNEVMRLDTNQNLCFGETGEPAAGSDGIRLEANGTFKQSCTGTGERNVFEFKNANGNVGKIVTQNSNTTYGTSSDYRLKENVVAISDGITRLKQLKPSRFNFIVKKDSTQDGFLAHEVQSVVPEAISGEKDAVKEDGSIDPQAIDLGRLVPLLVAAVQELILKVETLEAA